MKHLNAMLLCDFYKLSHRAMYPKGTQIVYSTWTPRESRIQGIDKVVFFGLQAFIKEWLIGFFNEEFFEKDKEEVVGQYKRIVKYTLGGDPETKHIEALHDLGYLPIIIKALPEGTEVPIRTPMFTIQNTHHDFFWLTNYLESLLSCQLWQACTSATLANEYRKVLDSMAMKTVGNINFVPFQGHDFSLRGMSSLESSMLSGMGHLLSFCGTDTIPAIQAAEELYGANVEKDLIGCSIPATEHSVQCAYEDDMLYMRKMVSEVHPNGLVSVVSDGYDFWEMIGTVLPNLKDIIMKRDGKVVIRPDSGDPVLIVCGDPNGKTVLERKGAIEALWDIFGGTISEKGYKVLDQHIGLIYGDAITIERATEIVNRLEEKSFASTNVVFGIGSYTYQYNTRDTFGFALKSTLCQINGREKMIFKDPKTDSGMKASQRGAVYVHKDDLSFNDGLPLDLLATDNALREVFQDGELLIDQSFNEIRERLSKYRNGKI